MRCSLVVCAAKSSVTCRLCVPPKRRPSARASLTTPTPRRRRARPPRRQPLHHVPLAAVISTSAPRPAQQ